MTHAEGRNDAKAGKQPLRPSVLRRRGLLAVRWVEHLLAATMVSVILAVATPITTWVYDALDCQDPISPARYIICLGGNPSRVIEGARLLQEGYADKLIVSNHKRASRRMRDLAIEWGAPANSVLIDDQSYKTLDHPDAIRNAVGVDPANDVCIIVTSYTHMARSKACFERAGYRHLVMQEPRWERQFRAAQGLSWKGRFLVLPQLVYEGAAWVEYWARGVI
jgi:uncharacterized SAM-binding protein YcdF (DUF218 family)